VVNVSNENTSLALLLLDLLGKVKTQPNNYVQATVSPAIAVVCAYFGARVVPHVCAGPIALAANLHVDAIVPGDDLRVELARRLAVLESKSVPGYPRRRAVLPV